MRPSAAFPFSAIVGQELLKDALLINAVDPRVGGVLIRGQKGTAKSTAVRALGSILPDTDVVEGCRFSCDPTEPTSWCTECRERRESGRLPRTTRPPRVVDLPVSATEDRLIGTLDLEHAIKHGERRFDPGLLASANRGILYVDEVNLLDDHLVDALLDAAAMGVNTVEREGVAFSHPARFMLVGTMNPEEGELRPQLLDRFGLSVDVVGINDPHARVEVVRRRRAFDEDPAAFVEQWKSEEASLRARIGAARHRLPSVDVPEDLLLLIATLCTELGVDGHRADITIARAVAAVAAMDGRDTADGNDVRRVAPLVLGHRTRRTPFEEHESDDSRIHSVLAAAVSTAAVIDSVEERQNGDGDGAAKGLPPVQLAVAAPSADGDVDVAERLSVRMDALRRQGSGRRQETRAESGTGRYVGHEPLRPNARPDVALDATLRQAAQHQRDRVSDDGLAVHIKREDIRTKVRTRRVGASICFCVDASGSMGVTARMEATKAAVLDLLVDAYQRRDRVGLVSFRGDDAQVILAPTHSVELAERRLRSLPTGGATPLAHGISRSLEVLAAERRRDEHVVPWLVLLTDGRANVPLGGRFASDDAREQAARAREAGVHTVVVDLGGTTGTGIARELARASGGDYVRLAKLDGPTMSGVLRERLAAG